MVARYLGVVEAAGSSPVTQTKLSCGDRMIPIFFYFQGFSDFFANQNHRFLRPLKPVFFATFCAKIEGGAKCVANETKNGTQGE